MKKFFFIPILMLISSGSLYSMQVDLAQVNIAQFLPANNQGTACQLGLKFLEDLEASCRAVLVQYQQVTQGMAQGHNVNDANVRFYLDLFNLGGIYSDYHDLIMAVAHRYENVTGRMQKIHHIIRALNNMHN